MLEVLKCIWVLRQVELFTASEIEEYCIDVMESSKRAMKRPTLLSAANRIDFRYHFILRAVQHNKMNVTCIDTGKRYTGMITKPLDVIRFQRHVKAILHNVYMIGDDVLYMGREYIKRL